MHRKFCSAEITDRMNFVFIFVFLYVLNLCTVY